ncbi:hypothetical protein [Blastococcus sp. SYSU D00820]
MERITRALSACWGVLVAVESHTAVPAIEDLHSGRIVDYSWMPG